MRAPAIFLSSPSPGPSWPMRLACLALLSPLLAQAQSPSAPDATRADAPTAPLPYTAMPPQPPLVDALPSPQAWRQAHEAVGAFPRGHADIVAWEAQRGSAPPPAPAASAAARMPHHHQGMQHGMQHGMPHGKPPGTAHEMHHGSAGSAHPAHHPEQKGKP